MPTIRIHVTAGAITCTPNGGHLRVPQGSELEWVSGDEQFTLTFQGLTGGGNWPFDGPGPTQPCTHFKARLRSLDPGEPAPAYKYSVAVGGKVLDPIVIVDK